jgi:NSS family neurotransmitter:Na+ symporter
MWGMGSKIPESKKMEQKKDRVKFSSKIGFVLAAASSAVGLGNLWRFPYLAAKYGGGIFLLTYIVLALTFGFSLLVAEIAIGRKTGLSSVAAFKKLGQKSNICGILGMVIPMIITPYYCTIGG